MKVTIRKTKQLLLLIGSFKANGLFLVEETICAQSCDEVYYEIPVASMAGMLAG